MTAPDLSQNRTTPNTAPQAGFAFEVLHHTNRSTPFGYPLQVHHFVPQRLPRLMHAKSVSARKHIGIQKGSKRNGKKGGVPGPPHWHRHLWVHAVGATRDPPQQLMKTPSTPLLPAQFLSTWHPSVGRSQHLVNTKKHAVCLSLLPNQGGPNPPQGCATTLLPGTQVPQADP